MAAKQQCYLSDLVQVVNALAPVWLAEPWDNVGLQLGHPAAVVRRVMTCLELTEPTLLEAVEGQADAIVSHHPLIFRPRSYINLSHPDAVLVAEMIRAEISLVAAHTNLDSAAWSTNTVLAERCGFKVLETLSQRKDAPLMRLVFTVRSAERDEATIAARRAGARRIDAIGVSDRTTVATSDRIRLEVMASNYLHDELREAVLAVAPSAREDFQSWPLRQHDPTVGLGLLAKPTNASTAEDLAKHIKVALDLSRVRMSGPGQKKIKRVAVCSGAGGSLLQVAAAKADVMVTGEINYHQAIEAHQRGLAVIEVGHYESEVIVARPLAMRLAQHPTLRAAGVEVFPATRDLQPFQIL